MVERSRTFLRRLRSMSSPGAAEIAVVLVLIGIVSIVALLLFQYQASEILLTVSHSV